MKENLASLVDACVEAHINAKSTMDAKRAFKALIQHAYEIGATDHAEEESQSKKSVSSHQGSNKKEANKKETSKEESESQKEKESRQTAKDPGLEKAQEAISNF